MIFIILFIFFFLAKSFELKIYIFVFCVFEVNFENGTKSWGER